MSLTRPLFHPSHVKSHALYDFSRCLSAPARAMVREVTGSIRLIGTSSDLLKERISPHIPPVVARVCAVVKLLAIIIIGATPGILLALVGKLLEKTLSIGMKDAALYADDKAAKTSEKVKSSVHLASYNVIGLPPAAMHLGPKKGRILEHRAPAIAQACKGYDVIGFQEAFDFEGHDAMVKGLKTAYPWVIGHAGENDGVLKLSSGLVLASKLPVIEWKFYKFEKVDAIDKQATKGVLIAALDLGQSAEGERQVGIVATTHLQAGGSQLQNEFRIEQMKQCSKAMKEMEKLIEDNKQKVAFSVICGDLNVDNSCHDQKVRGTLFDGSIDPGATNPNKPLEAEDKPYTATVLYGLNAKTALYESDPLPGEVRRKATNSSRIDYILLRSNQAARATGYRRRILKDKSKKSLSDHALIECQIKLKKAARKPVEKR